MHSNKSQTVKRKKLIIITILLIMIIILGYFYLYEDEKPKKIIDRYNKPITNTKAEPNDTKKNPEFKKEGELVFIDNKSSNNITRIDIEISDNRQEIRQGLMYRNSMADTLGMLFVFNKERMQSFWMKNTKIPLDIIFINKNKEIVTIQRNTEPFSESSIPSDEPAKYVVEVNAGFCKKHGIKEGDKISFLGTF